MRHLFLLIIAGFMGLSSQAQMPDSVRAHIDSALSILQAHSWYADSVNWDTVRAGAYQRASAARNKSETFDAIRYAWLATGDRHGMVAQYEDQYRFVDSATIARYTPALYAEWAKGFKIKCEMLGKTAYLRIPAMNIFSKKDIELYATMLYDSVASLAAKKPENWIIDLRMNGGGNLRPMLSGISLLFEDGDVLYWQDRYLKIVDTIRLENQQVEMEGETTRIDREPIPGFSKAKVAVIVGPGTGSSGEILAVALKQRRQTRTFGEETAGVANSTNGFVFNNDMSYLLFTTSRMVGRDMKPQPFVVKPDQSVKLNDSFVDLYSDNAVMAALTWLKKKR